MSALKPSAIDETIHIWRDEEGINPHEPVDVDDAAFEVLSRSRGWKRLKQHIEILKQGLDSRLSESVLKSLGDAQIKNDALFSVLGKDLLNSIISKVEDTALAVREIKDGKSR